MALIYIAGKIRKNRNLRQVVDCGVNGTEEYLCQGPIRIDDHFDYAGPFVIGCDHGCFHGKASHGAGVNLESASLCNGGDLEIDPNMVFKECLRRIRMSHIFLAWIDSPDCFGTLAEIGYSKTVPNQQLFIAFDSAKIDQDLYDDFWFVREFGEDLGMCHSIRHALDKIIKMRS